MQDKKRRKEALLHCWWECKLVQPPWRAAWRFLKKLKIELPYDPTIPLLGIYLGKNMVRKDTCTPMFIEALFTIAKTWNVHRQRNGLRRCDTYKQCTILSHKKEWDYATYSNMDGSRDCHTEWSKSDRKREILYDITYMLNLKRNYTN